MGCDLRVYFSMHFSTSPWAGKAISAPGGMMLGTSVTISHLKRQLLGLKIFWRFVDDALVLLGFRHESRSGVMWSTLCPKAAVKPKSSSG